MRLFPAILLPALLLLSACTSATYDLVTTSAIQTKFGDSDPQEFGDRTPEHYPVHGIDVSKWQGDIDWHTARKGGVSFVFIKATEGGDHMDPKFDEYWRGANAAGIPHAPYHFYYFCTPPAEQARWFIRNVPRKALDMPPVLDMEWNHHSKTCKRRPDPAVVRDEMETFLKIVERHFRKRPIIYTTIDFYEKNLDGHFERHPFWLRSVAKHPDDLYKGRDWHFWQYTGTGIVPGISGPTDINVFAGNKATWKKWLETVNR